MKNRGGGCFEEKKAVIDGTELRTLKWFDNSGVSRASTFEVSHRLSKVKRFDRETKQTIEIDCSRMVQTYNKFMGGVDLLHGLIAYYIIPIRSKKYYLRFFSILLICALYLVGFCIERTAKCRTYLQKIRPIYYNLEVR